MFEFFKNPEPVEQHVDPDLELIRALDVAIDSERIDYGTALDILSVYNGRATAERLEQVEDGGAIQLEIPFD